MFVGAVASSVRRVLASYAKNIRLPVLVVGAGNFTVPAVLRAGGFVGSITACDVSLYTSALGAFLAGSSLEVREKANCPDHLKGLLRTDTPLDLAASIALLLDLREVYQVKNPYQVRMFENQVADWPGLMEKTRAKLQAFKEVVGPVEYQPRDGFDFLAGRGQAHTVFAFPPTYKRGYERLEKLFGLVVEWTPPKYREMTDESLELYEMIAGFDSYFVVLEKNLPEVFAILGDPVAVLPRGRGAQTYILAKNARTVVVRQIIKSAPIGPIHPPDKPVTDGDSVSFAKITLPQSIRLNELFLSSRINYFAGGVGVSLAFLLDGQVIGKADFCPSAHQWKLPEAKPMIYLMCDLAVASQERRLAKLILLCLLSREVKEVLDLRYVEDFGWIITTAFSAHPVSMKYRGIFNLHKRVAKDGGFALNYFAPLGDWTLEEALRKWRKKYHK